MKDLIDAQKKENLSFGIKEVLRLANSKKLGKSSRVFISRDAREETVKKLEGAGVEFEVLKNKKDISRELHMDFNSEVFLVR